MTKIEVCWLWFRSKLSSYLLDFTFFVMPEGRVKSILLADIEASLDKIGKG